MNPRLVRMCAALVEQASPVALQRLPRQARALAPAGREMTVPFLGESVDGLRPFNDGDDPRTLEPRLSDLLETDVALEYTSMQLGAVLVIGDAALWNVPGPEAGFAGRALCALAAAALGKGGHPVRLGDTGESSLFPLAAWHGTAQKSLPAARPAAPALAWLDARLAENVSSDHVIFITNADWTQGDHALLWRKLGALAGDAAIFMLVHDSEVAPCRQYRLRTGAQAHTATTPGSLAEAFLHHARRLVSAGGAGRQPEFVRWSDPVSLLRGASKDLPGWLNGV